MSAASSPTGFTVSSAWLAEHLDDPGMSVVDASWYLPAQKRDARAEYEAGHIPRAVFFDHDLVVEPGSRLPHTLPAPEVFATHAGSMGISVDDTIVVYDGPGLFSAPRAWWMFRVMGARKVYVLEGGIDGWKAEGRFVTPKPTKIAPCLFEVDFAEDRVATLADMRAIVAGGNQPDRRRAAAGPLCRHRSRAAPGHPFRPHAWRQKRAGDVAFGRRQAAAGRAAARRLRRSRASTSTGRSSPPAAPASRRRS